MGRDLLIHNFLLVFLHHVLQLFRGAVKVHRLRGDVKDEEFSFIRFGQVERIAEGVM